MFFTSSHFGRDFFIIEMVTNMESKYMNIRKFAKINHISVNTLRLYVQWGLLTPSYVDLGTNYRYYTMR